MIQTFLRKISPISSSSTRCWRSILLKNGNSFATQEKRNRKFRDRANNLKGVGTTDFDAFKIRDGASKSTEKNPQSITMSQKKPKKEFIVAVATRSVGINGSVYPMDISELRMMGGKEVQYLRILSMTATLESFPG
jgi:hypothetical protein